VRKNVAQRQIARMRTGLEWRPDYCLSAKKEPPAGVSRWWGRRSGIGSWRECDEEKVAWPLLGRLPEGGEDLR
jgi:hypothetical protein